MSKGFGNQPDEQKRHALVMFVLERWTRGEGFNSQTAAEASGYARSSVTNLLLEIEGFDTHSGGDDRGYHFTENFIPPQEWIGILTKADISELNRIAQSREQDVRKFYGFEGRGVSLAGRSARTESRD